MQVDNPNYYAFIKSAACQSAGLPKFSCYYPNIYTVPEIKSIRGQNICIMSKMHGPIVKIS